MKYGFHTYAFDARSGDLRWSHRSATPVLAVFGSPRLAHLVVQAEIETFALEPDGTVAWRIAHSDVVTEAELIGGRLVLTSFGGAVSRDRSVDRPVGRLTVRGRGGDSEWITVATRSKLVDKPVDRSARRT